MRQAYAAWYDGTVASLFRYDAIAEAARTDDGSSVRSMLSENIAFWTSM